MFSLYAPWEKAVFAMGHWALGIMALVCSYGCFKGKPKTDTEEQCAMMDDASLVASEGLRNIASNCRGQHGPNVPVLYAHFLLQSLKEDICFIDVVNNVSGALHCAPGPFLLEHQIPMDVAEKQWQLDGMPDYFVWHLDNSSNNDENFYITAQNGFPIKSQVVKLQSNQESTLVLFPKVPLSPGVKYFLYLTTTTKNAEKTWIQPLEALAAQELLPKE